MPERADEAAPTPSAEPAASPPRPSGRARPQPTGRGRPDLKRLIATNPRLLVVIGLLGAGIVFVMLGWYGAAHTNIITEQIPYLISGGLLGLGLIIVAGIMAASASNDREIERLRREIARLAASGGFGAESNGSARFDGATALTSNGHHVFSVPGGRSYHEPGCPILEGKDGVRELQPAAAVGAGLAPCKLCAND